MYIHVCVCNDINESNNNQEKKKINKLLKLIKRIDFYLNLCKN